MNKDLLHNASVRSQEGFSGLVNVNVTSTVGDIPDWLLERLIESLAKYAHDSWASYMRYFLLNCGNTAADGTLTIPARYLEALWRLIHTPYAELTAKEQDADRIEAEKILRLIGDQCMHS